jgi:hypothetical protein
VKRFVLCARTPALADTERDAREIAVGFNDDRVRVLFTTTGHSGHLLPLVPLAHACEQAGHDVVVVTHSSRAEAVERVGLTARPV